MTLKLAVAAQSDADRIADIHMAAFGTNPLLLAQFPTPAIRCELRDCIAQKAADDIRDPNIAVLVIRDEGHVVSFAKWSLPVFGSETCVEAPWIWPEGTVFPVLNEWTEKVEAAQQKVLGELSSYRLTFIGTDPLHERRGAATSLTRWGLDRCAENKIPAYLESTLNAVPFYERLGFKTMETLSIDLEGSVIYEEACCLYEVNDDIYKSEAPSKTATQVERET